MAVPDLALELLWSTATHQSVPSMAQSGSLLVLPARHSKLVALDLQTGQEQWRADLLSPWGTLAVTEARVYYLNQHSLLQVFELRTGALKWSKELPGIQGWLHADQSAVILGAWRNYTPLTCLEASTGQVRWTSPIGREPVLRTAIYPPLQAVAVQQGTQIRWLSLTDGRELLSLPLDGLQTDFHDAIPSGVFGQAARGLLVRAGSSEFYRLTGQPVSVERRQTGQELLTVNLDEREGQVFFLNRSYEFCVYDLAEDRSLVMERVDHQRADLLPALRLLDGSYLLGTSLGTLWHFDPEGRRISRRQVCKRVTTQLFTNGRQVAFGTASGTVLGVQV